VSEAPIHYRGTARPSRRPAADIAPGDPPGVHGQPGAEVVIAALAARQYGVVGRQQLLGAGLPVHAIDHRVRKGGLRPLHRGVYKVGPLRGRYEREMAAVLACGPGAVLSHGSAAGLWKLLPRPAGPARPPVVDVTVSVRYRIPGRAVRVHRVTGLAPDETTSHKGIPITAPARTILDLSGSVRLRELERALARADRHALVERGEVEALLARYPRRPGTRTLRALLAGGAEPALTRSEAEARFLDLVRRAQLPAPEANVRVKGLEVDFLWRGPRLVVETDGFAYHGSATSFEGDRRRDAVLTAAGFRVVRITWRQLSREPEAALARLAQALVRV